MKEVPEPVQAYLDTQGQLSISEDDLSDLVAYLEHYLSFLLQDDAGARRMLQKWTGHRRGREPVAYCQHLLRTLIKVNTMLRRKLWRYSCLDVSGYASLG